jgi:hypothetical protein
MALFMVIERFKGGACVPVYRRLRERGRQMPDGLEYIGSWVDTDMKGCYQVMKAGDIALLNEWMQHWTDLVEFEVHPVIESADVKRLMEDRLQRD